MLEMGYFLTNFNREQINNQHPVSYHIPWIKEITNTVNKTFKEQVTDS